MKNWLSIKQIHTRILSAMLLVAVLLPMLPNDALAHGRTDKRKTCKILVKFRTWTNIDRYYDPYYCVYYDSNCSCYRYYQCGGGWNTVLSAFDKGCTWAEANSNYTGWIDGANRAANAKARVDNNNQYVQTNSNYWRLAAGNNSKEYYAPPPSSGYSSCDVQAESNITENSILVNNIMGTMSSEVGSGMLSHYRLVAWVSADPLASDEPEEITAEKIFWSADVKISQDQVLTFGDFNSSDFTVVNDGVNITVTFNNASKSITIPPGVDPENIVFTTYGDTKYEFPEGQSLNAPDHGEHTIANSIAFDEKGNTLVPSDRDGGNITPKTAVLTSAHPNPFNGKTNVDFNIPENTATAILRVYDVIGNLQRQLKIEARGQGSQELDLSELPDGPYFYYLETDGARTAAKTMVQHKLK